MKHALLVFWSLFLLLSACATPKNVQTVQERELQIHLDLAESYLRTGEPRRTVKELLPLAENGENSWRYNYALGHAYRLLGETSRSREHFQACTRIDPRSGDGWNSLGYVYLEQQKFDSAAKAFTKALDIVDYLTPELPAYNMARLYLEQDNADKALEFAQLSIEKNWRFAPGYELLARILVSLNRVDEAQKWLEKGVEANMDSPSLQLALAENLIRQGRNAQARAWFARIVHDFPETQEARLAGDYLDILP